MKRAALASGCAAIFPSQRARMFVDYSRRADLASNEIDERHLPKQLGHPNVEMIRRYQRRRDRFRVNLNKATKRSIQAG